MTADTQSAKKVILKDGVELGTVMQDATELKRFFQHQKAMLLIAGKDRVKQSTLLTKIISLSDPNHIVFRLKGKSTLTPSDLSDLISKHWAVRHSDTSTCSWEKKFDYLLDCLATHHQTCVLFIEQSHLLSINTLNALHYLALQQENHPVRIRIILSGYPELISAIHTCTEITSKNIDIIDISANQHAEKISWQFWQAHGVKSMAILALCVSGLLWWKMHTVESYFHATLSSPAHPHETPIKTG